MCVLQKTGRISKTAKVTAIIINRKCHTIIRPVRWDGNHWPWMNLKAVGPLRAIVAKRCEIGPMLLFITNKKWHALF